VPSASLKEKLSEDPSKRTISTLQGILNKKKPEVSDPVLLKIQRRVESALQARRETQDQDHLSKMGRKLKTNDSKMFDLLYLTPVVRENFSTQLVQCAY